MVNLPTFVTPDQLLILVTILGIIFIALCVLPFLWFYDKALKNRNKEIEENKKNLVNLKQKTMSNGVHKKKYE